MKKLLLISGLFSAAGLLSGAAAAQDVGKVISSTPITRQVTEPRTTCTNDTDGRQRCRTENVTDQRATGYKVVYEYAGRQYTTTLDASPAPGASIELEVTPTVRGAMPVTSRQPQPNYARQPEPVYSSDRSYSSEPVYSNAPVYSTETRIVERVVREPVYEPVYIEQPYYSRPYYYSSGYSSPWYPLATGLALGFTVGHYSRPHWGWHGHHHHGSHRGHWRR